MSATQSYIKVILQHTFYCATRMHSMFYAVARCPSHAGIVSKRLIIHILKVFSLSGSPTILVFPYQIGGNIPTGTTLTGESNAKGV